MSVQLLIIILQFCSLYKTNLFFDGAGVAGKTLSPCVHVSWKGKKNFIYFTYFYWLVEIYLNSFTFFPLSLFFQGSV